MSTQQPHPALTRKVSLTSFVFRIPEGKTLSDYFILGNPIGQGSFGSVFDCFPAQDTPSPQPTWWCRILDLLTIKDTKSSSSQSQSQYIPLACKTISKQRIESSGFLDKFGLSGIAAALTSSHPNIVRYFQFLEDEDNMYVIMSKYTGMDLFDYFIENKPLQERDIKLLMRQILSAISFVHSSRGIHRDIKTENFVFERMDGGNLKLVDFGSCTWYDPTTIQTIQPLKTEPDQAPQPATQPDESNRPDSWLNPSKQQDASDASQPFSPSTTQPQRRMSVVGTTGYCAPEVFKGEYTQKIDVFSAGVILFILSTGEMPFECRDIRQYQQSLFKAAVPSPQTPHASLWRVLNMKGDRLRGRSDGLRSMVESMLSMDPQRRLTSQEALQHPWLSATTVMRVPTLKIDQQQPTSNLFSGQLEHIRHDELTALKKTTCTDIDPNQISARSQLSTINSMTFSCPTCNTKRPILVDASSQTTQ